MISSYYKFRTKIGLTVMLNLVLYFSQDCRNMQLSRIQHDVYWEFVYAVQTFISIFQLLVDRISGKENTSWCLLGICLRSSNLHIHISTTNWQDHWKGETSKTMIYDFAKLIFITECSNYISTFNNYEE
jgi:hypothetical protein